MSNEKLCSFFKGSIILVIFNIIAKATNFFLLPLYTKYLSPDQLGMSDTIISMGGFIFPVLVLGFDAAFGAFYYEKESLDYKEKVFNTVYWFLKGMSIIAFFLLFFSNNISSILFNTDDLKWIVILEFISIIFNMWFLPYSLLTRIENKMFLFSIINLIASISMIGMNILFITYFHLGFKALIISSAFTNILQLCLYSNFVKIKISVKKFDKKLFGKMLHYAVPIVPVIIAEWILNLSDRYVLLYFRGEYEVGLYGIAARFQSVLSIITNAIFMAYTAYGFSSVKEEDCKQQYIKVLDIIFFVLAFISMFVGIYSKEIMSIMAQENYKGAYVLIAPLLFGQVFYALNTIIGYGFAYVKKSYLFLIPVSTGATTNIILNIIFIPMYGVYAATFTTLIGYFVMFVVTYIINQKVYYCNYNMKKMLISFSIIIMVVKIIENFSISIKVLISSFIVFIFCAIYYKVILEVKEVLFSYLGIKIKKHIKEEENKHEP